MVRQVPSPWTLSLLSQQLQLPSFLMWSQILRCFVIGYVLLTSTVCMLPRRQRLSHLCGPPDLIWSRPRMIGASLSPLNCRHLMLVAEGQAVQATCPFVTSFCFCAFGAVARPSLAMLMLLSLC